MRLRLRISRVESSSWSLALAVPPNRLSLWLFDCVVASRASRLLQDRHAANVRAMLDASMGRATSMNLFTAIDVLSPRTFAA